MLGVSSGVAASGGDGVNYSEYLNHFRRSIEPLLINGAIFEGGNGGIVINNTDDLLTLLMWMVVMDFIRFYNQL